MQHGEMPASAGGLGCQRRCHSRPRAAIRRSDAEAMRIRRAPSRNPGDRLHVSSEQQLLFNAEIQLTVNNGNLVPRIRYYPRR